MEKTSTELRLEPPAEDQDSRNWERGSHVRGTEPFEGEDRFQTHPSDQGQGSRTKEFTLQREMHLHSILQ